MVASPHDGIPKEPSADTRATTWVPLAGVRRSPRSQQREATLCDCPRGVQGQAQPGPVTRSGEWLPLWGSQWLGRGVGEPSQGPTDVEGEEHGLGP